MEGFEQPKIKTGTEGELNIEVGREERIRQAEIMVKGMFNKNMEAAGMIMDRIREKSSFSGPEDRNL
jgi:hypothetical protein